MKVGIVGGGIIGCSIAYELSKIGIECTVFDKGEIGREASWAAAGLLSPIHIAEYDPPLQELCLRSISLYRDFVAEIDAESGISSELIQQPVVYLAKSEKERKHIAQMKKSKVFKKTEEASGAKLEKLEPSVKPGFHGLRIDGIYQVRTPHLMESLVTACRRRSVCFKENTKVLGLLNEDRGIRTESGDHKFDCVAISSGAWSSQIKGTPGKVKPIKGQIVAVRGNVKLKTMVIWGTKYALQRRDGLLLLGSTAEDVGFDTSVTIGGVTEILQANTQMIQGLDSCSIDYAWAGLRPYANSRNPIICRNQRGTVLAYGHFRAGIILAPATAELVRKMILENADSPFTV